MLATELQRLAQTVENLGRLTELGGLLEEVAGALPVRCGQRLAAEPQQLVSRFGGHPSMITRETRLERRFGTILRGRTDSG